MGEGLEAAGPYLLPHTPSSNPLRGKFNRESRGQRSRLSRTLCGLRGGSGGRAYALRSLALPP